VLLLQLPNLTQIQKLSSLQTWHDTSTILFVYKMKFEIKESYVTVRFRFRIPCYMSGATLYAFHRQPSPDFALHMQQRQASQIRVTPDQ
jgi:hypothetical protein